MTISTNQVWFNLISSLMSDGDEVLPRGLRTKELMAYQTKVDMGRPVLTLDERKLGYKFMPAEAAWILSGDNRVKTITPYSKAIAQFSDDGLTFGGAYGPPVVDQLPWCVDQLIADPLSRQAVLTIWRPRPGRSNDIPCTVALQFMLRRPSDDDAYHIYCNATMRSSDAWLGWPYDVFNFSMISGMVAAMIMHRQPGLEVKMGELRLTAGSQHVYHRHWDACEEILSGNVSEAFQYDSFDPSDFWTNPFDLVDHLWALAEREHGLTRSPWLTELFDFQQ